MKKSKIAKFIFIILVLVLILGIGCLFGLPWLYDLFKDNGVKSFGSHHFLYQIAFYTCYIFCLLIVYQLILLFKYIYSDTPFLI